VRRWSQTEPRATPSFKTEATVKGSDEKDETRPGDLLDLIRAAVKRKPEVSYEPIHPKGSSFRAIPILIVVLALFGIYLLFGLIENSEPLRVALDFLKSHPEVQSSIGEVREWGLRPPISYNSSERHGNAGLTVKLKGTKGEMKASVSLEKKSGRWIVVAASYVDPGGKNRPLAVAAQGTKTSEAGAVGTTQGKAQGNAGRLASGIRYFQENRLPEAIAEFGGAVEDNPNDAAAYYWRGRSFARLKQYEKSGEDLRKSIALDARNFNALNWLGWVETERRQWREALAAFSKSLEVKPGQGWTHYQRGRCHDKLGEKEKALQEADAACRLGFKEGCRVRPAVEKKS